MRSPVPGRELALFSWFYVEEGTDDFQSPFFSFLKSNEFGNNKDHDTFSPDAKITLKGLPFYSSVRTWGSPTQPLTPNVYGSKKTHMHLFDND